MEFLGLARKKALVTGGSRGIGRSATLHLVRAGADVAINYIENANAAANVVQDARSLGSEGTFAVRADVAEDHEVARLVREVLNEFGRIDILIHSAGIAQPTPLTPDTWDRVMRVHLYSTFYLCQEIAPIMKRQGGGKIVIIGSIMAHQCWAEAYSTAMAGKICYAKGLAKELAPYNINVNVVSPGTIFTDMLDPFIPKEKRREVTEQQIPIYRARGGVPGPDDVGKVIAFLASDLAAHIVGEDIQVNGGQFVHA